MPDPKLRIFYASDTTPNTWMQGIHSNIWRNNLYASLVDMGHDLIEFDYDLTPTFRNLDKSNPKQAAFIETNRPKVSAALFAQIEKAHREKKIDLFFSYFYDACVIPDTLKRIKKEGIRIVNWYCNGSYQIDLVHQISPIYDHVLVPEKFRLPDYRAMGAHPIYCQEAANPVIYKPYNLPIEYPVTFVGQAYGDRPLLIKYLLDNGIQTHVWGHGWANPDARYLPKETYDAILSIPERLRAGPLADEDLVKMYSRSAINLGFSTCGNTHLDPNRILQIRLRDFEVPMSGGFYLVEQMDELNEFFHPEKEIVCYSSKENLLQKVRHYLAHPEEREIIRQAGHARALKDHSWKSRFSAAFQEMGLI